MRKAGLLVFGLALAIDFSLYARPVIAADCKPWPTRPSDSVRLVSESVTPAALEGLIEACKRVETPDARYAEATFLVNLGDLDGAIQHLRPLAASSANAAILLADILTQQAGAVEGDTREAQALYHPFVNGQDPRAEEGLAVALLKSARTKESRAKAFELLQRASSHGSSTVLGRVGAALYYSAADGDEKSSGLSKLESAASGGDRGATIELARVHLFGWGLEQNQARAASLLDPLAKAGSREAQYLLAFAWLRGWRIPLSKSLPLTEEAMRLTKEYTNLLQGTESEQTSSAEKQKALQARIGEINNLIQPHLDNEVGISLLRSSALQEYLPAVVHLGTVLAFGRAGQFEPSEGIGLLKAAMDRGDGAAAERLGILCELGVANLKPGDAGGYYDFAAKRNFLRSILAKDRIGTETNKIVGSLPDTAKIWGDELKSIETLRDRLKLGEPDVENPYRRVFRRGLPVDAPYFEGSRIVRLSVRSRDGTQRFGALLVAGDRVYIDRSNEVLQITRMGPVEGEQPLGAILENGNVSRILKVPGRFEDVYESADGAAGRPSVGGTGIKFRATEGPENAITVRDVGVLHELRTSGYKGEAPYVDSTSRLSGPVELEIPAFSRLNAVVRGGTSFEIIVDGLVIAKASVPEASNLYFEFSPEDLRAHVTIGWPETPQSEPTEVVREWLPRPAPSVTSDGKPIGWLYSRYDSAADGLYASFLEMNASILAFGAEIRGEWEKSLRLRSAEYELALTRAGGSAIETMRMRTMLALPLEALGRTEEAIALRETALHFFQSVDVVPEADIVDQLLALGNLYWFRGDVTRAIAAAKEALARAIHLPKGAQGASSTPFDLRAFTDSRRPTILAAMKGFPHDSAEKATAQLATFYLSAEDFARSYAYFQRLAAFDLLNEPDEESNGNMDVYVAISDLAHRSGKHWIGAVAGAYVLNKAKADAGQRDKPDPIPTPVTMPQGIADVFGPMTRSAIAGRALMRLGDAYWAAQKPWSFAEPVYDAALKAGLGSTGPATSLTVRAAARLAFARWATKHDKGNLSMLQEAASFDPANGRFPRLGALDRDNRAMFATAYLGTLSRPNFAAELSESDRARAAVSILSIDDDEPFARDFQIARLKRRAETGRQQDAINAWANAKSDFDRSVRRLNSALGSGVAENLQTVWEASRSAQARLTIAEQGLTSSFQSGLNSLGGSELVKKVQGVLEQDEVAVSLMPTRYAVYAVVITKETAVLRYALGTDVELVERIRALRLALDPATSSQGPQSIPVAALLAMRPYTTGLFEAEARLKRRWIVFSHDVLRNVPIEAIPIDTDISDRPEDVATNAKSWPGLDKEIGYLPNLAALVDLRSNFPPSKATRPVWAMADPILPGDPRYDNRVAAAAGDLSDWFRRTRLSLGLNHWLGDAQLLPVPETSRLAEDAVSLLGGTAADLHAGRNATTQALASKQNIENSKVLIFATHGETAESYPLVGEPFLVFTSREKSPLGFDPLVASEIAKLNLDAEVVFLSACSTAAADGTPARAGFSGLADAFLSAGARSLVVTEWKVQTGPAHQVVLKSLDGAIHRQAASGEAVRSARLELAKRYPDPAVWSAFVYIGDPGHHWTVK